MRNYKTSNRRSHFQNRDGGGPSLHSAVCSDCGQNCKVPFKPSGNKLIYCFNCFKNHPKDSSSKRDSRGGNRRDDYSERRMHGATCDKCHKRCEVPFKPTGDKPVYCSNCFEQQSGNRSERSDGRRDNRRADYSEKMMYTATCDDCNRKCEVPFKPTSGKPIFCKDCFKQSDKKRDDNGASNSQLQDQINVLDSKLDYIIETLDSLEVIEEEPENISIKEEKKAKKSRKSATEKKETKAKKSKKSAKNKVEKKVKKAKKAKKATKKANKEIKKKATKAVTKKAPVAKASTKKVPAKKK